MQPLHNARAPAAEPCMQLYHLGLLGHCLSNLFCPLALTPPLSAPGA